MSGLIAHLSVVPAAGGAPPAGTPFVTGQTLSSTLRNDGGGYWLGFQFIVVPASITITHFGRWKASGDSATHDMQLFDWNGSTSAPISGPNATVDMSQAADPDGYVYVALGTPYVVYNTTYEIGSKETGGVDHFYEWDNTLTYSGAIASIANAFYYLNSGSTGVFGGANKGYVPVNFKYT